MGARADTATPGRKKLEIAITVDVKAVVDAAEKALVDAGVELYQRAGILVRVVRDGARRIRGVQRALGAPTIQPLPEARLMELMAETAEWTRFDKRTRDQVGALPAKWAVQALAARGQWRVPYLDGVVETPVLRADGSLLDQPGYDPQTGILFEPHGLKFPPVVQRPSLDDARKALRELMEPFAEFPHVSTTDMSAALAAVLTLLARPAILGPCPLFAIRGTAPGTGKSLQVDVIAVISTGRVAARMAAPKDDDESRKRILAIGLEGVQVVLIDNVEKPLGSASLAAALTAEIWSDRLLGLSKTITVPLRAVWMCTGNNLTFKGDLGRRVVPCDLDAQREHPEDRTGFKQPELRKYVLRERPRLVTAGLTILRAFPEAGRPKHGKPLKGSFEDWDRLIRAALIWVADEDPLAGCERIRANDDADLQALRQCLTVWSQSFGREALTAAQVVKRSESSA